jgi:hypothetical protein
VLLLNQHGGLGHGALVVKGEQTAQDFLTGHRADRIADEVVLGQGFGFMHRPLYILGYDIMSSQHRQKDFVLS